MRLGGSALMAIDVLKSRGVPEEHILFLNLIASPEGAQNLAEQFPKVRVVTAFVDAGLDEKKYVLLLFDTFNANFLQLHSSWAGRLWRSFLHHVNEHHLCLYVVSICQALVDFSFIWSGSMNLFSRKALATRNGKVVMSVCMLYYKNAHARAVSNYP
jgi:hypothetical protein